MPLRRLRRSELPADTVELARYLIGKVVVHDHPQGRMSGRIVETEAYPLGDAASHAYRRKTARNAVMYMRRGHAYVYLIYGMYYCLNVVAEAEGTAGCVLIRAIEPIFGEDFMRRQRVVSKARDLTNGPAKLCEAMSIDRGLDGVDLRDPKSALFIAQNPSVKHFRKAQGPVIVSTRIGITRAAALPLRFYLKASPCVSRRIKQ